jgi:hypothetical protein
MASMMTASDKIAPVLSLVLPQNDVALDLTGRPHRGVAGEGLGRGGGNLSLDLVLSERLFVSLAYRNLRTQRANTNKRNKGIS